jgi:hypothetical protein
LVLGKCVQVTNLGKKSKQVELVFIPKHLEHPGITAERRRQRRKVRKANPRHVRQTEWFRRNVLGTDDPEEAEAEQEYQWQS